MDEGQEVELVMDQEELDLPPSLANSDHHSDSAEDGVSDEWWPASIASAGVQGGLAVHVYDGAGGGRGHTLPDGAGGGVGHAVPDLLYRLLTSLGTSYSLQLSHLSFKLTRDPY